MKKLLFPKIISLLMVSTMVLSACGSTSQKTATPATDSSTKKEATKETEATTTKEETATEEVANLDPISVDWYVNESWFSSPKGNLALELIKEGTGVDVNFIAPVGDPMEKLNAMIASNTLPDLVTMGWWLAETQQLSVPDYSYSYDELGEMAPGLMDQLDASVLNWYSAPDGKTYAYPCNSVSESDIASGLQSNRTFLVRKDIYEAIGSPDMRTPDGFVKALEDAKAKFPTALNGEPLIPFGTTPFLATGNTGLEDMLLEFLAVPREFDGKFEPVVNGNPNPEYITWLKALRLANEKGLIPTDFFIDDRTKVEEKIQQGRYFAMLYQAQDALLPLGQLYKNAPDSTYIAVDGPANSKLETAKLGVPGYSGWEVTFVTKNAKNPERIAKLLEWGHSDDKGQIALFLGKEGVTYDVVEGKEVFKHEVVELKNSDMSAFKQQYNVWNEYWMFAKTKNIIKWEAAPVAPFDQYKEWGKGKAAFYGVYDNIAPPADSDEAEIGVKVNNKWGEVLPKLISAQTEADFDKIWADFEKYKADNDYDTYLQFVRNKVEENKNKMK